MSYKVLMNDFNKEPKELRVLEKEAVCRVVDSGWFILGKEVESFEAAWAKYTGAKYCVGVANGLDALEIGLRASGITHGDEIITTPLTAIATSLAILRAGGIPVFADVEPETGLLDLQSVERCLSSKTKGLLPVHLYGRSMNQDACVQFCQKQGIQYFEDCAQAHNVHWNQNHVGTSGAWGAFSFYPTKNLGAKGDAGALITNDAAVAEKAKKIRNYGQSVRYYHPEFGFNSRLDEMQAALLVERLKWLDEFTESRRKIAEYYYEHVNSKKIEHLKKPLNRNDHVHHLFVIKIPDGKRNEFAKHMDSCSIQTHIHYPVSGHKQEGLPEFKIDPKGLSQTDIFTNSCISLPCHPGMNSEDLKMVCDAVNRF